MRSHSRMSAGKELQVDGAATGKAQRARAFFKEMLELHKPPSLPSPSLPPPPPLPSPSLSPPLPGEDGKGMEPGYSLCDCSPVQYLM